MSDEISHDDFEAVWRIGVYDAHCHPTDIMDSIARIPGMKAKALTVMSTRAQDQALVEQSAEKMGLGSREELDHDETTSNVPSGNAASQEPHSRNGKIIPAFGWHPWFSHQIWDDRGQETKDIDFNEHYKKVLTPQPDEKFLSTLPNPTALSDFLAQTEKRLLKYPLALIGEVGVDRSFRLPEGPSSMTGEANLKKTDGDEGSYTPGSREGRPLSPYKVSLDQQKMVMRAQLGLAAKHSRAASVHSVQAHGLAFEVLQSLWKGHERLSNRQRKKRRDNPDAFEEEEEARKAIRVVEDRTKTEFERSRINNPNNQDESLPLPFPPRICMHSFSGPPETLRMFLDPKIPADIYISFSECINFNSPSWKKAAQVIELVPQDRILVESDLHCAGHEMDRLLESIVRRVCEIRGWGLDEGAGILRDNWMRFIFG